MYIFAPPKVDNTHAPYRWRNRWGSTTTNGTKQYNIRPKLNPPCTRHMCRTGRGRAPASRRLATCLQAAPSSSSTCHAGEWGAGHKCAAAHLITETRPAWWGEHNRDRTRVVERTCPEGGFGAGQQHTSQQKPIPHGGELRIEGSGALRHVASSSESRRTGYTAWTLSWSQTCSSTPDNKPTPENGG